MRGLTLTKFTYISLSIAVMACVQEREQNEFSTFEEVKLQAQILTESKTRVLNDNEWCGLDRLGVFMIKSQPGVGNDSANIEPISPYINLEHSVSAGTTGVLTNLSEYSFRYPSDDSSVDFVAYYPYLPLAADSDSALIGSVDTGLKIVENDGVYLYPIDMSVKDIDHDFLYARTTEGYSRQNNGEAVSLQFRRMMAKLVINVKVEVTDEYNETSICDAVGVSAQIVRNAQAYFNLSQGKLQDIDGNKSLAMDASKACVSAIVIPNKGCADDKVVFTYANHNYTWSTAGIEFKQGYQYNYTLTLRPKNIDVVLNSTIANWTQISGDDQFVGEDGFNNSSNDSTDGSDQGDGKSDEEDGDGDDEDDRPGDSDDNDSGGSAEGDGNQDNGTVGDDDPNGGDDSNEDDDPKGGDDSNGDDDPKGGDDSNGGDNSNGDDDSNGGDNSSGDDDDSNNSPELSLDELRAEITETIYTSYPELDEASLIGNNSVISSVCVNGDYNKIDALKLGYSYDNKNDSGGYSTPIVEEKKRVYFYALAAGECGSASGLVGKLFVTITNSAGIVKEHIFYPEVSLDVKGKSGNLASYVSVTKENLYVIDLTGVSSDSVIKFEKTEGSAILMWGINFI